MSLTPDQIIDRNRLKRQLINWRFFAIIFAIIAFLLLFSNGNTGNYRGGVIDSDFIARIYIDGMIFDDSERLDSLKSLAENKNIKGVIIHINSPGGTVVGGENLYNAVRRISGQKPVTIVMGDVAASAAYMIAVAGDHLIAHYSTLTGSIGVLAQSFEVTELAKKIGIKFYTFKTSPLKGGPLPTEELTPEMIESMNEPIRDIYNLFFNMVAERRKIPVLELQHLADGRIFTGNQALKNGLIDEIGDEETAIKWLKETKKLSENLKVKDFDLIKEPSKLDMLLNSFHTSANLLDKTFKTNFLLFS